MFNDYTKQTTPTSGENGRGWYDLDQSIEELNSLGEWVENEQWLIPALAEVNKQHRAVRRDVRDNADSWSYADYCQRLAYHYYSVARYHNDELYNKHNIGQGTTEHYLKKCVQQLEIVALYDITEETKSLKHDAEQCLAETKQRGLRMNFILERNNRPNNQNYARVCIASGNIKRIPDTLRGALKKTIQNVQLLQVVVMLEDAITVRGYRCALATAERSDYLGQAYQIAGLDTLANRYRRTAAKLFDSHANFVASSKRNEWIDINEEIGKTIFREIRERHSNLKSIKQYLEEEFHGSLGTTDDAYVDRKFTEQCSKFYLEEIKRFFQELNENKNREHLLEVFESLGKVNRLTEIPSPLNKLGSYLLLMEHYAIVSNEDENALIKSVIGECAEQVLAYSDSAGEELGFLDLFLKFLSKCQNFQLICVQLNLNDFCQGALPFPQFLQNIINLKENSNEYLKILQEQAKSLQCENDLFFLDDFQQMISAYIRPADITEKRVDGRLILEVIGANILVSEIVGQIEMCLSRSAPGVDEVRFIVSDVMHVDVDFPKTIWHGKNIVVQTNILKIVGRVIWNVSGEDNSHTYLINAGTGKDGHGNKGSDGYPGESGGNVLILAENIEHSENFTIISNGGNGSKGQNGGNGTPGKDGKGIEINEFKKQYRLSKTMRGIKKRIKEISSRVEIEWYDHLKHFIEAVTSQGNRITLSGRHVVYVCHETLILYKGSPGLPGGEGGEYGLGGQGGYAGDISVDSMLGVSIESIMMSGKDGETGDGGLCGNYGQNGWDVGCVYKGRPIITDGLLDIPPTYYGADEKSIIELKYYDEESANRVWCPYKCKWAELKISSVKYKNLTKHDKKNAFRQSFDRQHHARANRKKHVSKTNLCYEYHSHCKTSAMRVLLQEAETGLMKIKQRAVTTIVENQKQREALSAELENKRQAMLSKSYYRKIKIMDRKKRSIHKNSEPAENLKTFSVPEISQFTVSDPYKFKQTDVNLTELKQFLLCLTADQNKDKYLEDLENKLIEKYRLGTLQEISKNVSLFRDNAKKSTDSTKFFCVADRGAEYAARYLTQRVTTNSDSPNMALINDYLCDCRKGGFGSISESLKKHSDSNKQRETLERSLKLFILDVKSESKREISSVVDSYYDDYKNHSETRGANLNILFQELKKNLSQSTNENLYKLWIESLGNENLKNKFKEEVKNDNDLKTSYGKFMNVLNDNYDWSKCCDDKELLREFCDHVTEKGLLAASCRGLLADIFDINIRVYAEDPEKQLYLTDNHNTTSTLVLNILCREKEVIELDVNESYLKLEAERKEWDKLYAMILTDVNSFKKQEELDEYLSRKEVISCNGGIFNGQPSQESIDEEENIKKILEYFTKEEKEQLQHSLRRLTFEHSNQRGILGFMLKRFSSEGKHVALIEILYLINSVVSSTIEKREEQHTFTWIVAAYSQHRWMDELILIQLENYYTTPLEEKSTWRQYLSRMKCKQHLFSFSKKLNSSGSSLKRIPTESVGEILYLLSNTANELMELETLHLSEWLYVLKENHHLSLLSALTNWEKSEEYERASYYVTSLGNTFGVDFVGKIMMSLNNKSQELSSQLITEILSNLHNEKWVMCNDKMDSLGANCTIHEWMGKMNRVSDGNNQKPERDISELAVLIQSNGNTSANIKERLANIVDSTKNISDETYTVDGKTVAELTDGEIIDWSKTFKEGNPSIGNVYEEMLAVIDRAIELTEGFRLRDTQKLSILTFITNDRNTLAQVSTGEGKTLIVLAVSLMKALCGQKVHVITSSSVLAKRDADNSKRLCRLFGINVSHNCGEDVEERRNAYSSHEIVYGDLSSFQRDYLLDRFYGLNIFGDHRLENVVVDEVDSMLLDKGNNTLYLSHDIPGFDKLESVYVYIWKWINKPARQGQEVSQIFDVDSIKKAILCDLNGTITIKDIRNLDLKFSGHQKHVIWNSLVNAEIIDNHGQILKENISDVHLGAILPIEYSSYVERLKYVLKERVERNKSICIPNYLKPFAELHLESWIKSAIKAFFMKADQDYVVDVDRTGTKSNRKPNITIIDRDTGVDQPNSQWEEALHQFLQLKHGCQLSLLNLKSVFISNVSYFKLYKTLYGLTGTLGSHGERDLMQEIYEVDYVTIPTSNFKQFVEYPPVLCADRVEWISVVRREAKKVTEQWRRSVLIICDTIDDARTLCNAFGGKYAKQVHAYVRDYENFEVTGSNSELEQGQIIIATNLAGRGTDIKITRRLEEAGGLHVCLTFLPSNIRVEEQSYGRAARKGQRGSGQLIIVTSEGSEPTNSKLFELKSERDRDELHRVSSIKSYFEACTSVEERCFNEFRKQHEVFKRKLDESCVASHVKEILLESCMVEWAFWLDRNIGQMKQTTNRTDVESLLDNFISELKAQQRHVNSNCKSWTSSVQNNSALMTKLGKYLAGNGESKDAILMFDEVIKQEPQFCEAAHYYKAFSLTRIDKWYTNEETLNEFRTELENANRIFEERHNTAMLSAGIINQIKKENSSSNNAVYIDGYKEQKKCEASVYTKFMQSIDDILGHGVTPEAFLNGYDINEDLAECLHKKLIEKGLIKASIDNNVSEEILNSICFDYGLSNGVLTTFLCGYSHKEIKQKEFLNALDETTSLPSREKFWKLLIQKEILCNEIVFLMINEERLAKIDHLLFDELKRQNTVEKFQSDHIFLNAEVMEHGDNQKIILENDFVKIVGNEKYRILLEMAAITINKAAHLSSDDNIEFKDLSSFDSISVTDFTDKAGIVKNEAELILAELVQQKILKQMDGHNAYTLTMQFDENDQDLLPSYSLYENATRRLLNLCFAYRIALQRLIRRQKKQQSPINLSLTSNPHQMLFCDLLRSRIIRFKTSGSDDVMEETLKNNYMTQNDIKDMLSENIFVSKRIAEDLCSRLVTNNWISKRVFDVQLNKIDKIDQLVKINIQDPYYIGSASKRRTPIEYFLEDSHTTASHSKSIDKLVEYFLDNRLLLTKDDTIKSMVRVMKQLKSLLDVTKNPVVHLESLMELYRQDGFVNTEETLVFSINALDDFLRLEEKKWTGFMICSCIVVICIALVELTAGALILWWSAGSASIVADVLVSESISDLQYACSALTSGYFSWKDYGRYKAQSIIFSGITACATFGLGKLLNCTKFSYFGYKIAGPTSKHCGKLVAETTGKQLIKATSIKEFAKQTSKFVGIKAVKGIASGFANAGIDCVVNNYLQDMCSKISSNVLSSVDNAIESHECFMYVEKIYQKLGEEDTRRLVNTLTENIFTEQNIIDSYAPVAIKLRNSVLHGITAALERSGQTNTLFGSFIKTFDKFLGYAEIAAPILNNIGKITTVFCSKLSNKLSDELKKLDKSSESKSPLKHTSTSEEYKAFKQSIVDRWKSSLHQKVGEVIAHHIIGPILKKAAGHLIHYAGRTIERTYKSYKNKKYSKKSVELKQNYEKDFQRLTQDDNLSKEGKDNSLKELKRQYVENLTKLQTKTTNVEVYTRGIREGAPLSLFDVDKLSEVAYEILQEKGEDNSGVRIDVTDGHGIQESYSSGSNGESEIIIPLHLQDHHYSLVGGVGSNNDSSEAYDCSIDCVKEKLPQLSDVSSQEIRNRIADKIENDATSRYYIQKNWQRFYMEFHGGYGGAKNQNRKNQPFNQINTTAENLDKYQHRRWEFDKEKDIDLRFSKESLSNDEINTQINEAFNKGLDQINQHLKSIGKPLSTVTPAAFNVTKYDCVICADDFGEINLKLYPIEIECNVEVKLRHSREPVVFKVHMDMDNPVVTPSLNGPHGPHVGYKVVCNGNVPDVPTKLAGHILLNKNPNLPDRGRGVDNGPSLSVTHPYSKIGVKWLFENPPSETLRRSQETDIYNSYLHENKSYPKFQ